MVVSSSTTISATDIDVGVDAGNIVDSAGDVFQSLALLLTFLRTNTGG